MSLFPLFVDLAGKRVVVVGGGTVGRRKAAAALAAGAVVGVVDPKANPDREGGGVCDSHPLPHGRGSPEHIRAPYSPDHLAGAHLVFACATPDVNARVVSDAKARGIWVNAASDPGAGDVFLPAVVTRGDLTIAVGTGGASPALARRIRDKLEAEFDESFAAWVQLLAELRPVVLQTIPDAERRQAVLDALADWPWLDRLRAEGVEAVRAAMWDYLNTRRSEKCGWEE